MTLDDQTKVSPRRSSFGPGGDPPAWIETLSDEEARASTDPILAQFYQRYGGRRMAHILRSNNLNPRVLRAHYDLYRAIMHGPSPLTRVQREMIGLVVSLLNQCDY